MKAYPITFFEFLTVLLSFASAVFAVIWWCATINQSIRDIEQDIDLLKAESVEIRKKIDTLEDETSKVMGKIGI